MIQQFIESKATGGSYGILGRQRFLSTWSHYNHTWIMSKD